MFYSSQLKQLALAKFWHSAINAVTTRSISNFAVATATVQRGDKNGYALRWRSRKTLLSKVAEGGKVSQLWKGGTDAAIFSQTPHPSLSAILKSFTIIYSSFRFHFIVQRKWKEKLSFSLSLISVCVCGGGVTDSSWHARHLLEKWYKGLESAYMGVKSFFLRVCQSTFSSILWCLKHSLKSYPIFFDSV